MWSKWLVKSFIWIFIIHSQIWWVIKRLSGPWITYRWRCIMRSAYSAISVWSREVKTLIFKIRSELFSKIICMFIKIILYLLQFFLYFMESLNVVSVKYLSDLLYWVFHVFVLLFSRERLIENFNFKNNILISNLYNHYLSVSFQYNWLKLHDNSTYTQMWSV